MRIVAGEFRGRTIEAKSGTTTRPTTDRVREALMSALYSARGGFEGAVVLDAFAGSGALGLEALSRGAARVVFFENDAKAAQTLDKNIASFKLDASRARVCKHDVLKTVQMDRFGPFDIVFLDPPYAYSADEVLAFAAQLRESGALSKGFTIVYEHALSDADQVSEVAQSFGFSMKARKYGKTGVAMLN